MEAEAAQYISSFHQGFLVLEKVNKNIQAALFLMKVMALHFVSVIFFNKFVSLLV